MNRNIAARAGRWSAAHWKTAVSAWLAFCVVAIALGAVAGTKMLKQADTAAGGTRTAEQILQRRRLPGPRRRERARPVEDADASTTRRSAPPSPTSSRTVSALPQVQRVRSPLDARERGPGLAGPALGARPVRDPGRRGQGRQEGAAGARRRRRRPGAAPRLHGGRVRLRERDPRAEQHAEQGLPAGRVLVAAGDADRSCSSRSARWSRPGCRCCSPSRACSRRSVSRRSRATSSRPATRRSR